MKFERAAVEPRVEWLSPSEVSARYPIGRTKVYALLASDWRGFVWLEAQNEITILFAAHKALMSLYEGCE